MKTETEFDQAHQELFETYKNFRLSKDKSSANHAKALADFEEKLNVFRNAEACKPRGALFEKYLKEQAAIMNYVTQVREKIIELNEQAYSKNPLVLPEPMPHYILKYTAPMEIDYESTLYLLRRFHTFEKARHFSIVNNKKELTISLLGDVLYAREFLKTTLPLDMSGLFSYYSQSSSNTSYASTKTSTSSSQIDNNDSEPSSQKSNVGFRKSM